MLTAVRRIFGRIAHSQIALRSQWDKRWKNNLPFTSPSIRRPTAKLANAHEFIMKLPDGYQTELKGSGNSLSQGQRQLLAIARVAVADPPVLILDEATSSIDTRTEKIVQDGICDRPQAFHN